jgi:hypothetical protein
MLSVYVCMRTIQGASQVLVDLLRWTNKPADAPGYDELLSYCVCIYTRSILRVYIPSLYSVLPKYIFVKVDLKTMCR